MQDFGIVPVGFNDIVRREYEQTSNLPGGPRSFVSKPEFEFYRDPENNTIMPLGGNALLASKILYKLFTPLGSSALDTSKGSFLEDLVGGTFDKATLSVSLVRAIQRVEEELKESKDFISSIDPDTELESIKVDNLEFSDQGEVTISLVIKSQSGKFSSLQVGV